MAEKNVDDKADHLISITLFKANRLWLECSDSKERSACETHQLPDLTILSAC